MTKTTRSTDVAIRRPAGGAAAIVASCVALVMGIADARATAFADETETPRQIFGWVENARLMPEGIVIKAKLDTGARTSALHARDINEFERDGKTWVSFRVPLEEHDIGLTYERHVHRHVRIKEHDGRSQRRPVVFVDLCLGGHKHKAQVSLVDRSNFNYPLLIGRRVLRKIGLVDSNRTFVTEPDCETGSP